jgi:hypothetical protein
MIPTRFVLLHLRTVLTTVINLLESPFLRVLVGILLLPVTETQLTNLSKYKKERPWLMKPKVCEYLVKTDWRKWMEPGTQTSPGRLSLCWLFPQVIFLKWGVLFVHAFTDHRQNFLSLPKWEKCRLLNTCSLAGSNHSLWMNEQDWVLCQQYRVWY